MFYLLNRHQHSTLIAHWSEPLPRFGTALSGKDRIEQGSGSVGAT